MKGGPVPLGSPAGSNESQMCELALCARLYLQEIFSDTRARGRPAMRPAVLTAPTAGAAPKKIATPDATSSRCSRLPLVSSDRPVA